jgi:hypothetical protein
MSIFSIAQPPPLLELHSGDKMTQEEFHRIYSQMPEDFQAELVGGHCLRGLTIETTTRHQSSTVDHALVHVCGKHDRNRMR